jgi:glutamate transport system substrate-binding protein
MNHRSLFTRPTGAGRRSRVAAQAFAVVAVGALALSACGSDSDGGSADVADAPKFAAGSTMAKLADAGKITIGTKFDQPGFGLKALSGKPEGFDVEVGKIIAGKLGIAADKITWKETISAVREDAIEKSEVDVGNQYTNA